MISFQKNPDRDFTILNLADTQLSFADWEEGNKTGEATVKTIRRLVEETRPDLITTTGDIAYAGSTVSYHNSGALFDSFGIPWTLVWGNHDNQKGPQSNLHVLEDYRKFRHFFFEDGPAALGSGNFVFDIRENNKPVLGVICLDTHDREPFVTASGEEGIAWGRVTPAQVRWYEERAAELREAGCPEQLILAHIPFYAYREAYQAAATDPERLFSLAESYTPAAWKEGYRDSFGVKWEEICSYPAEDGMLDAILGSQVKATVLCGHDHNNNFVISYRGVRLAFALKTGPGCYGKKELNGGTVITVGNDGIRSLAHHYVDL